MGPRYAKEGEVGTDPEVSLEILPEGEGGGIAVEVDWGVAWSWVAVPVLRRLAGGMLMCLGDAPVAEADSFEEADRVETLELDRERLNLIDSTSSESMSERSELGASCSSMMGSEGNNSGLIWDVFTTLHFPYVLVRALSEDQQRHFAASANLPISWSVTSRFAIDRRCSSRPFSERGPRRVCSVMQ